ncbi:glutathione peroxidase [uncultured Halopseudomonas sp.]|uniref:glutathione peroxidase n=1 Tax=uncultured Halopseudomonas sp. TaxID=2901193 RepID=UPI0030EC8A8F|tara:strand:- start:5236 stop:5745 length:510 start_codon:yes stop_codon:yes gene_type:complete
MTDTSSPDQSENVLQIPVTTIDNREITLGELNAKAYLVVNTASKCGFTPQYKGLEALWQSYHEKGLQVAGFPCNQFGGQEPGDEEQIAAFCETHYGVSFPMFAKVEVNGSDAHPLFKKLKSDAPGLLGSKGIKWNFTKFLVDGQGKIIGRYAPSTSPADMAKDIESLLG